MAGRALRPLRRAERRLADEIGRSADLARRLPPVARRDDVGRLTASFNAMMDRLQEAYRRLAAALAAQQRFTADASHELRTPLTTIRSNAGFLLAHPDAAPADRAAALGDIEAESERMSRLVDDLLTLARADAGQRPAPSRRWTSPSWREDGVPAGAGLHPDRSIALRGAPAGAAGDADALRRLLWILVDNAVGHTATAATCWVAVTQRGLGARCTSPTTAPGIPAGRRSGSSTGSSARTRPQRPRRRAGAGDRAVDRPVHGGAHHGGANPRGGARRSSRCSRSPAHRILNLGS